MYTMRKFVSVWSIILLPSVLVYVYAAIEHSYFQANDDFRDLYCPAPDAGPTIVESLTVCGHRCSGTSGCVGIFYNLDTRACNPRVAVPVNSECDTESGSRYFSRIIDCGEPPTVLFASVDSGDTLVGSVRQYTCHSGYRAKTGGVVTMATTAEVTCQIDEDWGVDTECVLECATIGPLVTGPDGVADNKMTASSAFNDATKPHYARLDGPSAWASATIDPAIESYIQSYHTTLDGASGTAANATDRDIDSINTRNTKPELTVLYSTWVLSTTYLDLDSYIQFEFAINKIVSSITTQGLTYVANVFIEWVTSYHVLHSTTCVPGSFVTVKDATGSTQTFTGNVDAEGHVSNTFATPILARCVRVNARTWNSWISLRVELYGC